MKPTVVVTSITPPNAVLKAIADGAAENGMDFIVVGDTRSPPDFALPGCRFVDIDAQRASDFRLATACPVRSYARKNIGYLLALSLIHI